MSDLKLLACIADDDDLTAIILSTKSPPLPKIRTFNFDSFTDQFCWLHFRFYKDDIIKLKFLLKFPPEFICRNRLKVGSTEAICILLKRMAYPNRYVDMMKMFPRTRCEISRIFNAVISFMIENHGHRLRNLNHNFMKPSDLKKYAESIHQKGSPYPYCVGFIDGTVRPICRPENNQREYYNGHKRTHAIKFQSVILPSGIIVNMYGPIPGRRHDAHILQASNLMYDMEMNLNNVNRNSYYLYGDPAYPLRKHLMVPYKGYNLNQQQQLCNRMMSKVREAVEWGFGKILQLFPFLDFKKNLKIGIQQVGNYYLVGTILSNCHTCLYGGQTSDYFNCAPPTLEVYLL